MPCKCREIRNFVSKFPLGDKFVSLLPKLKDEEIIVPAKNEYEISARRAAVIAEAKTWLKTPFHHMARVKGAGVDCGQLLLAVYHNAGCMPYIETEYYPRDFYLHSGVEWYKTIVEQYADETDKPEP